MTTRGVSAGATKMRQLRVSLLALTIVLAISTLARASSAQQNVLDYWSDRRLTTLENYNLDGRLRVVESDMFEVKWLTRTVTATLIGQFILAGISLRRKS